MVFPKTKKDVSQIAYILSVGVFELFYTRTTAIHAASNVAAINV